MILSSEEFYSWSRHQEVIDYAGARGLNIGEAIHELVNAGLSHQ